MTYKEHLQVERDEIMTQLTRKERAILHHYEAGHGRVPPGAIEKVIADELDRSKSKGKRKRKK